jgi:DNA-binding response OmpR family regulator
MGETLLLVEDDVTLRETLALNLRNAGYEVVTAGDGVAALEAARQREPDLVLLDLMLPELDGLSVCRSIREFSQTPIIILTARTGELDKIIGLESGADDYLTKPFGIGELQARIRTQLRRTRSQPPVEELRSCNLVLNLVSRRATLGGADLLLSPKEFNLLAEMMRHRGSVLSRDLLLTRVWGYDFLGDSRTVDVHVCWLRDKIEFDPAAPRRIVTVRALGYRFEG